MLLGVVFGSKELSERAAVNGEHDASALGGRPHVGLGIYWHPLAGLGPLDPQNLSCARATLTWVGAWLFIAARACPQGKAELAGRKQLGLLLAELLTLGLERLTRVNRLAARASPI